MWDDVLRNDQMSWTNQIWLNEPIFEDFTELPCLDAVCVDVCLEEWFTDKFCATKCQKDVDCVQTYEWLVASNAHF